MRRSLLSVALLTVGLLAGAQEAAAPQAPPPTPAQLDRAIEDFARQIPAGITADRYAAFAVAMPADATEYQALNKHALLVVAALSKDPTELPLKRVYLEQEKRTTELSPFAVVRSEVPADSPAGKLMGTHRVDAYYLIPLSAWRQPGTLLADFAANRKEFIVGRFPLPIKEDFIRDDAQPEPVAGQAIGSETVQAIVQRAVTNWREQSAQKMPVFVCWPDTDGDPHFACRPLPQRIRVSSGVAQGLLTRMVQPHYPESARANRLQGRVILHVIIGKDGVVQQVDLVNGHPALVPAAVEAVRQWRYHPYLIDGEPVEVDTQITVVFQLR